VRGGRTLIVVMTECPSVQRHAVEDAHHKGLTDRSEIKAALVFPREVIDVRRRELLRLGRRKEGPSEYDHELAKQGREEVVTEYTSHTRVHGLRSMDMIERLERVDG
jgi:hypothetical protein